MPLDTSSTIALVASSSVIAAIITQGLGEYREWLKLKKDSGFSSLYLALALEAYASECSIVIGDSENYDASGGNAGVAHRYIPDFAPYPETIEWKPMGLKSATAAMSFRVDVETTRAMISGYWEFGDEDDAVPLVRLETARLGCEALRLALTLRKLGSILPTKSNDDDWNVNYFLAEQYKKYLTQRNERELRNKQMIEEMNTKSNII
jgi:hypothetical protein